MTEKNPQDSSNDAEEVLSLQELEADEVEAHGVGGGGGAISTLSTSVVGQCGVVSS
jgi:hypothetical protein